MSQPPLPTSGWGADEGARSSPLSALEGLVAAGPPPHEDAPKTTVDAVNEADERGQRQQQQQQKTEDPWRLANSRADTAAAAIYLAAASEVAKGAVPECVHTSRCVVVRGSSFVRWIKIRTMALAERIGDTVRILA